MDNEKIVTFQLQLTRRKAWLLLTAFFICWHPGFLGSETLTLTTYYPAPYGGYASLLTTGKTLLARDVGNVLIGMSAQATPPPVASAPKVDVNGSMRASGEIIGTIATGSGQFRAIAGSYGVFTRNDGSNTYMPLVTAANDQYGSWNALRPLRVNNASGDLYLANSRITIRHTNGSMEGLCTLVTYTLNGGGSCTSPAKVFAWYGNGAATSGMLFLGGALESAASWSQYVSVGADRSGQLLCCKIQNY